MNNAPEIRTARFGTGSEPVPRFGSEPVRNRFLAVHGSVRFGSVPVRNRFETGSKPVRGSVPYFILQFLEVLSTFGPNETF
jgi:hypothetical protein